MLITNHIHDYYNDAIDAQDLIHLTISMIGDHYNDKTEKRKMIMTLCEQQ
jgi:hypothetical protein